MPTTVIYPTELPIIEKKPEKRVQFQFNYFLQNY